MPGQHDSVRFRGVAYRHSAPVHAEIGSTLLEGSRRAGGRFNPTGEFGALYLSLDTETMWAELSRLALRTGVELTELDPRTMSVVRVRLKRVLDLRNAREQDRWGIDDEALMSEGYGGCQALARAARRAGFEGILYPSAARPAGSNLVVFLDRLDPNSDIKVTRRKELSLRDEGPP